MRQVQKGALGGCAAKLEGTTRYARQLGRTSSLEKVTAPWRVDFIGKVLFTLRTLEAPDKASAIEKAAKTFHVEPARQNRIAVTRLEKRKRGEHRIEPGTGETR
jgi:hypothetical protein